MLSRRSLFPFVAIGIATPAIVRAESLMRVRALPSDLFAGVGYGLPDGIPMMGDSSARAACTALAHSVRYRSGPWGEHVGDQLTTNDIDNNFYLLAQAIDRIKEKITC